MVIILVNVRTNKINLILSCPLSILGISLIGLSLFLVTRLDFILHHNLYNYGLQFSYEWAEPYWSWLKLIQDSLGLAVTTNTISFALIVATERINRIWVTIKGAMRKHN